MSKVWFVTGTSTGIGRSIVEQVLERGDIVVATLRKPPMLSALVEQYSSSQLLVLKCDVTNHAEVKEAFEQGIKAFKRIDVVVNNAGIGLTGEAEAVSEDYARKMFDVNFWGAANVSREALRVFREVNAEEEKGPGGKLINITSTAGIVSSACLTYYAASKHALEGFTEGLQKEVDPKWNISVSMVELGAFRTKSGETFVHYPVHPAYTEPGCPAQQMRAIIKEINSNNRGDPDRAALKIYELAGLDKPPVRIALGEGVVDYIVQKLNAVKDDLESYRDWSDGLNYEN